MWRKETNPAEPEYFNFFSYQPQGPAFLAESIRILCDHLRQTNEPINRVFIWSDNGMKSYASVECWSHFLDYLSCSLVRVNHFAPHHGHGPADAMFGRGKMAIRGSHLRSGLVSSRIALATFNDLPRSRVFEVDDQLNPYPLEHMPWKIGIRFWFQYDVSRPDTDIEIDARVHVHDTDQRDHFTQKVLKNHAQNYQLSISSQNKTTNEDSEAESICDDWEERDRDQDPDWIPDDDPQVNIDKEEKDEYSFYNISSGSHQIPNRPQHPTNLNMRYKQPTSTAYRLARMDSSGL
jgi:hypothetical protein